MPFKEADMLEEEKMLNDLLAEHAEAREAHEEFMKEYNSRKSLENARKKGDLKNDGVKAK